MTLIDELKWRGLVLNMVSGTSEQLESEPTTFYVGTDPTGKSLHVGHLLAFIVARLLQKHGHKPIVLVGGATASLGDPSFKAEERRLMSREEIDNNAENIKKQLSNILDFNSNESNAAIMVNNYDWMRSFSFLDFARDIGKLITVNYMMSKDSVKTRLEREGSGLSFTEFTYQLLQGYDFLHLNEHFGCKMQIGGSDQWGNITTGQEIIRKKLGCDVKTFALVWPLATRADGSKFGKSEGGKNVWLDPTMTTPYEFYQFWLNQSDDDAVKYIKMFTLLPKEQIEQIISEHQKAPQLRLLQKELAKEVTTMVHSKHECDIAIATSDVLFGKASEETLLSLSEEDMLRVFDGVPTYHIDKDIVFGDDKKCKLTDVFVSMTSMFKSKGDLRKLINSGGLSINKTKVNSDMLVEPHMFIHNRFCIVQQGKKTYKMLILK